MDSGKDKDMQIQREGEEIYVFKVAIIKMPKGKIITSSIVL